MRQKYENFPVFETLKESVWPNPVRTPMMKLAAKNETA
jgi:hypothetical protein